MKAIDNLLLTARKELNRTHGAILHNVDITLLNILEHAKEQIVTDLLTYAVKAQIDIAKAIEPNWFKIAWFEVEFTKLGAEL